MLRRTSVGPTRIAMYVIAKARDSIATEHCRLRPGGHVTGAPEELLLFAVGRAAKVEFGGDASAVQAVRDAPKGL